MKRLLKRLLISTLIVGTMGTNVYARDLVNTPNINTSHMIVYNNDLSEKYDDEYTQMLDELNQKVRNGTIASEMDINSDSQIYSKSIKEEDSIVTLGIIYSLSPTDNKNTEIYSSDFQGTTELVTHAKVYARVDIDKNTTADGFEEATLTNVEGEVIALLDGARLTNIDVHAFQTTLFGQGDKHSRFSTQQISYDKSFSWEPIKYSESTALLGQTVDFTFKRGTSTVTDSLNVTFGGGPL